MKPWFTNDRWAAIPFLGFYFWLVIKTAWVSDDAFITFRSIENFLHGYGPVFNIGERVQTFTHPLWFLAQSMAGYIFDLWQHNPLGQGQMYFLNIFLCIGLSLLTVVFFTFRVADSTKGAILGLSIFSLSKSFVDYSTSGLENPLTHLILLLFIFIFLTKKADTVQSIFFLALLASLGGLNRLDALLFYAPALLTVFWQSSNKQKTITVIGLGFLPLIIWEIFSVFYYGVPFPNTAYAKMNTGISISTLIKHGLFYYLNSLKLDPITLLTITAGLISTLIKKNNPHKIVFAGIVLYLLYILYIGGDFMSGRFFSTPLLASTALLSRYNFKPAKPYNWSLTLILIIGIAPILFIKERQLLYGDKVNDFKIFLDSNLIADERKVYNDLSLSATLQNNQPPSSEYARADWIYDPNTPAKVRMVSSLGLSSYKAGPNIHIIDINALADPLMVRLPLTDPINWRIGHFQHIIPKGYIDTLSSGQNLIEDKNIALYYEKLSFIIKGELWSSPRMLEIWKLNTGKYNYLLKDIKIDQPNN